MTVDLFARHYAGACSARARSRKGGSAHLWYFGKRCGLPARDRGRLVALIVSMTRNGGQTEMVRGAMVALFRPKYNAAGRRVE